MSTWSSPRAEPARFRALLVICALSSCALSFAQDPAIFYACFGAMALSAYGLIVDDGTQRAKAAGDIYLAVTVLGEAALLIGLLIGASGAGPFAESLHASPWRVAGMLAILIACGLKVSILGLGGWMPEAYRAATRGSGAALAGVVSSAGVVGLARFMPGGVADLSTWGAALVVIGLASAFYGVAVGIFQHDVRHALAYSSMSQFGLMWVCIGTGLAAHELWTASVLAVAIYLLHHGLAKAALFAVDDMGAAGAETSLTLAAFALPALSLAGVPLTSGAVAKVALKSVVAHAPGAISHPLETLLPLTALGTTLLMLRVLSLLRSRSDHQEPAASVGSPGQRRTALALLWVAVAGWVWLADAEAVQEALHKVFDSRYAWSLAWPVLAGCAIGASVWVLLARGGVHVALRVPAGDVWRPVHDRCARMWESYQAWLGAGLGQPLPARRRERIERRYADFTHVVGRMERSLLTWEIAGLALALVCAVALVVVR